MKKLLVLLLLVSLGLNVGLGLTMLRADRHPCPPDGPMRPEGGPPPGRGGRGPGEPFGRDFLDKKLRFLDERLDLTDEQIQAFRDLQEGKSAAVLAQAQRVHEARMGLREAAGHPDTADLRGLISNVGRAQARLDSMITEVMFGELDILTAEQRQKYLGLMPADRFERRFGPRPGGRGRLPRNQ